MTQLHGGLGRFALDSVYPSSRPLSEEEIKKFHLPVLDIGRWVVNLPSKKISKEIPIRM